MPGNCTSEYLTVGCTRNMPKLTHFDIGAWAREKKQKKQEIVEKNSTIVNLNEEISSQESKIRDLK